MFSCQYCVSGVANRRWAVERKRVVRLAGSLLAGPCRGVVQAAERAYHDPVGDESFEGDGHGGLCLKGCSWWRTRERRREQRQRVREVLLVKSEARSTAHGHMAWHSHSSAADKGKQPATLQQPSFVFHRELIHHSPPHDIVHRPASTLTTPASSYTTQCRVPKGTLH